MKYYEQAIGSTLCKVWSTPMPKAILIQPSARHEEKNGGTEREVAMLASRSACGFVVAMFDTVEWARALMPWHDDAVSRDRDVGVHSRDTLCFILHELLPWLRGSYGQLPCIIGGYSLGGMFALWAAAESAEFSGVAAASPSLWIDGWTLYAQSHPLAARCAYLSLGDREEHCRNQRMRLIGDCVRQQHELLRMQLGDDRTAIEWNRGGHFGEEAERTARAFLWCLQKLV